MIALSEFPSPNIVPDCFNIHFSTFIGLLNVGFGIAPNDELGALGLNGLIRGMSGGGGGGLVALTVVAKQ